MSPATPIVFVVDDDVAVRESLEAPMPYAGWRVETFASAQQFLACPRARGPSCLLLDVSLPDLNGFELMPGSAGNGRSCAGHIRPGEQGLHMPPITALESPRRVIELNCVIPPTLITAFPNEAGNRKADQPRQEDMPCNA